MIKNRLPPISENNDEDEEKKISILKNIIKLYPETTSLHLLTFQTPIFTA